MSVREMAAYRGSDDRSMVRLPTCAGLMAAQVLFLVASHASVAITIRHDVPESSYLALGAEPRFATAGLVNGGTTCAVAGGVLIAPHWALTAAHCVPNTTQNQTVVFNLGPNQNNLDVSVTADNWFRHTGYSGDVTGGRDLALIHLPDPILQVTPARLWRTGSELGKTITVVGYGRFGTGLTGDNQPRGTRRGGNNVIDVFGSAFGLSPQVAIFDFDNPSNPGSNVTGSSVPLPLEAMVALNDSGSPWFIDEGGLTYVAAITSFRAAVDGPSTSIYGDLGGGTRVSTEMTWIDNHHDRTLFWGGSNGNWNVNSNWIPGTQPAAMNAAVIDLGRAIVNNAGRAARYVFVDGNGQLDLGNSINSEILIVRGAGILRTVGQVTQASDLIQESGTLRFNIGGTNPGSGYDRLNLVGAASVSGSLEITVNTGTGSYTDPTSRGQVDTFTLLTANDLVGTFDSVTYNGSELSVGANYAGTNQQGQGGLFRYLEYVPGATDAVVVRNYLALPGDANGDFVVDGQDFVIWNTNKFQSGTSWMTGDFNGDGVTDGQDFVIWNTNKFLSVNPAPLTLVPEPTFCISGCLIGLWLIGNVRRRRGD